MKYDVNDAALLLLLLRQWVGSIFERGLRDALGVSAKAASDAQRIMSEKDLARGSQAGRQQQKWSPFPGPVSSSAPSSVRHDETAGASPLLCTTAVASASRICGGLVCVCFHASPLRSSCQLGSTTCLVIPNLPSAALQINL